jgi:uncharacterized protein (DUF2252 family)
MARRPRSRRSVTRPRGRPKNSSRGAAAVRISRLARAAQHPWELRHAQGKALRVATPRGIHAGWKAAADRPDPIELIVASNAGRQSDLVPIRMSRMASSVFGFFRGSAAVMAWDLARTPVTGIHVLMDGDAHLANFGLFGTVERDVVFDLNDFDESQIGHWEWDLKRLVVSTNVAARDLGWSRVERRAAVLACAEGYRDSIRRHETSGALSLWYEFLFTRRRNPALRLDATTHDLFWGAAENASQRSSDTLLARLARKGPNGEWRFREIPPVQLRIPRGRREKVIASLDAYSRTLPRGRRYLFERYRPMDVAEHIVGVGSVGARVYAVLLFGNGEGDPLLLQVKEGLEPAARPYLPALPPELVREPGKRVVSAQMALQSSPDLLLGWTRIDGRSFYVRQMRNLKGSVPLELLSRKQFLRYVRACGEILGHAHARTGDAARIAGYCGRSAALDVALERFAEEYGDQVVRDHARLVRAIAAGTIVAAEETRTRSDGSRVPRRTARSEPLTSRRPSRGRPSTRRKPTSR